jgi:hypothetical protein
MVWDIPDLQEVTGGEERFLPAGAEPLREEDALALSLERLLGKVGRRRGVRCISVVASFPGDLVSRIM